MISKQIAALALGEEEGETGSHSIGVLPCPVVAYVLVHFSELNAVAQELLLCFILKLGA